MNEKLLKESKRKLERAKEVIEKSLERFAKKDKNLKGDWDALFPLWNGDSGSSALERAADQVEEFGNLLSLEYSLETKLKNINSALEKINLSPRLKVNAERSRSIKKGGYGKCETCKKEINKERLKICPEAKVCLKCEEK